MNEPVPPEATGSDPLESSHMFVRRTLALLMLFASAAVANAQESYPGSTVKVVGGYAGFLDDATIHEPVLGAAYRLDLAERLAIEPEFLYLRRSARERSFVLQLNVIRPIGPDRRVRPYLVAGAGIRHLRAEFPGAMDPTFSDSEFTGGGGGGVRVGLSERFRLSPEFRLGWEPLIRATVALGYQFP
jgi:hypothetical protein